MVYSLCICVYLFYVTSQAVIHIWRSEDRSVLSLQVMGPGDQIQIGKLVGSHLFFFFAEPSYQYQESCYCCSSLFHNIYVSVVLFSLKRIEG